MKRGFSMPVAGLGVMMVMGPVVALVMVVMRLGRGRNGHQHSERKQRRT